MRKTATATTRSAAVRTFPATPHTFDQALFGAVAASSPSPGSPLPTTFPAMCWTPDRMPMSTPPFFFFGGLYLRVMTDL